MVVWLESIAYDSDVFASKLLLVVLGRNYVCCAIDRDVSYRSLRNPVERCEYLLHISTPLTPASELLKDLEKRARRSTVSDQIDTYRDHSHNQKQEQP